MKPDISDAITETSDGIIVTIDVTTGSKRPVVPAGYNEWRSAIICKISAAPIAGKANKEICKAFASVLGISEQQVTIVSGHTSTKKRVLISNLDMNLLTERLLDRI